MHQTGLLSGHVDGGCCGPKRHVLAVCFHLCTWALQCHLQLHVGCLHCRTIQSIPLRSSVQACNAVCLAVQGLVRYGLLGRRQWNISLHESELLSGLKVVANCACLLWHN